MVYPTHRKYRNSQKGVAHIVLELLGKFHNLPLVDIAMENHPFSQVNQRKKRAIFSIAKSVKLPEGRDDVSIESFIFRGSFLRPPPWCPSNQDIAQNVAHEVASNESAAQPEVELMLGMSRSRSLITRGVRYPQ